MKLSRKMAAALMVCALFAGCNKTDSPSDDKTSESQSKVQLNISPAQSSVAVDEEAVLTYAVSPSGTEISNIKVTASGGKASLVGKKILFTSDKTGDFTISLTGESKDGTLKSNEAKISVKTEEELKKEEENKSDDKKDDKTEDNKEEDKTASTGTAAPANPGTVVNNTAPSGSNGASSPVAPSNGSGTINGGSSSSGNTSSGSSTNSASNSNSGSNSSSSSNGSSNNGSDNNSSSGNNGSSNSGSSNNGSSSQNVPAWIYEKPITVDELQEYSEGIIDSGKTITLEGWLPSKKTSAANGKKEYCFWNNDWTSYIIIENPSVLENFGVKAYVTGKVVDDGKWAYLVIDSYELMK